ncbi:MAG: hypothetical protein RBT84_01600, partial [FCB group bacterium]|nr:hypothetical protein [FCB group bacterium]
MNRERTPHSLWHGVIAAAALVLAAADAAAVNVVTLREEAFVKGPQVALGDVAEVQGAEADAMA